MLHQTLHDRWYELDVVYKGGLYVHDLWVEKAHKNEKRTTLKEREEGVIKELSIAATVLIENLRREYSLKGRIKKLINQSTSWLRKWEKKKESENPITK